MSISSTALRLLSREVVTLRNSPPEGIRIVVDEDDLSSLEGWVQGPEGTPYQGGYFRVKFEFGPDYPNLPPRCTMLTKIFHPNISKKGEICVDTLKKAWKKDLGVKDVLETIKCLLIAPNPESALDEEAGKQLLHQYDDYAKYARLMTSIHASPKIPPPPFRDATSRPATSLLPQPPAVAKPASSNPSSQSASPQKQQPAAVAGVRPPLGNNARQETSPAPTVAFDAPVKPVVKAPVKAPKAKRGLKRL